MINVRSKYLKSTLFIATLATIIAMRYFDEYLTNEICTGGIISFEFSKTLDCAQSIMDSWDVIAKTAAGMSMGLDYLFLILYSSTIALLIYEVVEKLKGKKLLQKTGRLLIYGIFIAAVFDGIENFALIKLLLGDLQQKWVTISYAFASIKFALVGLALAYLIPCLIYLGIKKLK